MFHTMESPSRGHPQDQGKWPLNIGVSLPFDGHNRYKGYHESSINYKPPGAYLIWGFINGGLIIEGA